jgi:sucrose-6-phosphate hydrolase SacC (GH32 family)
MPDLFELPVDGPGRCEGGDAGDRRWVLVIGVGSGGRAGGTGTQYFIGEFDGTTFTSENARETVLWADHGADFYAAQSWNGVAHGRRIWAAWMNNWTYAQDIPTSTWRGTLTLPRELALTRTAQGIRLVQQPVAELQSLRKKRWRWDNESIAAGSSLLDDLSGETLEILAGFQVDGATTADRVGFRLRTGEDEHTTIAYAVEDRTLFVDRAQSGQADFHPGFPAIHTAEMRPIDDAVRLHIFVDRSSVEVFGNDGQVVMTERIFPDGDSVGLELFAEGGKAVLRSLDIYALNAAAFGGYSE